MWAVTSSTTPSTTALSGTVITDAPITRIAGPHNDGADFYGLGLGLLAIVGAIALTRLVFRRRGRSGDAEGTR
jgi:hypothetical protein